jgi:trigger factor
LKIESQARDDHQVKLVVEFEAGVLEDYKRHAARHVAQRIRIPGFRPGKAPYNVVLRQVGDATLTQEAIEHLVEDKYSAIIDEAGIRPYANGQFENLSNLNPLTLEFLVPLEPVVTLGDYQAIRRAYEPKTITEADVDDVIENLRERQAVLTPSEQPVAEGDVVAVLLSGSRMNPKEDEQAGLIKEDTYQFLVRSVEKSAADEWPFPGFSRKLIGHSKGEGLELTYKFADDYEFEKMAGVEASYLAMINEIKTRQLPEVNEEFIKSLGEYADLAALREEIRTGLTQQNQETYDQTYDQAVLDELVGQSTILYPPQMLQAEQNTVVENFKRNLQQQGQDFDLYLKSRNTDLAALLEEAKPVAQGRLKRSLVLLEVSKAENLQGDEGELQTETMNILRSLNQSLGPDEARRLTDERIMNNLVGNVMIDLLTRHAGQRLRDIASGAYTPGQPAAIEQPEAEEQPEVEEKPEVEPTPSEESSDEPPKSPAEIEVTETKDEQA